MARPVALLVSLLAALAAPGCLTDEEGPLGGLLGEGGLGGGDGGPREPAWGDESGPIRPGASLGGYCTFNFLFYDNVTGAAYIGTAGHCTEEAGERVSIPDVGEIGTVVYDSDVADGADVDVDFALIELDADRVAQANPRMLGHDGPAGIYSPGEGALGQEVGLHGYGMVLGEQEATRDRSGILFSMDERMYTADMPAVNGDSGSPLLHLGTGTAVGIISHYGIGAVPPSTDEGPVLAFILSELAKGGFPVQLAVTG